MRFGTVAMTIRGMDVNAFERLGEIVAVLLSRTHESEFNRAVADEVSALPATHPAPKL
jgi:glycine/serine hydroxymethyltransferase